MSQPIERQHNRHLQSQVIDESWVFLTTSLLIPLGTKDGEVKGVATAAAAVKA
jgi:hypothetical protein